MKIRSQRPTWAMSLTQGFSHSHCMSALPLNPPTFQNHPGLSFLLGTENLFNCFSTIKYKHSKDSFALLMYNVRKPGTELSAQSSHQRGRALGEPSLSVREHTPPSTSPTPHVDGVWKSHCPNSTHWQTRCLPSPGGCARHPSTQHQGSRLNC